MNLQKEAKKVNERYPNAPLPSRAFHLQTIMKVQYDKKHTYDYCMKHIMSA